MDYNDLLVNARTHIKKLPVGQVFFVKDLFYGTEWNELERGEKLGFGRCFKKAVQDKSVVGVQFIGKADNNSAQYRKIQEEERNEATHL